jgi:hypothetical protein
MTNEAPAAPTEPTPTTTVVKKKGASRIITPILALVAALAIGLFAGVLIGHATATPSAAARTGFGQGFRTGTGTEGGTGATGGTGGTGTAGGFGGGAFGGGAAGTIVSISGDTIVLKETNGTKVTVTTSGTTSVTKTTKSTVSSLKAGETIRVIGATSGSTVKATIITEGATASFGGGFRPGGTTGSGNN